MGPDEVRIEAHAAKTSFVLGRRNGGEIEIASSNIFEHVGQKGLVSTEQKPSSQDMIEDRQRCGIDHSTIDRQPDRCCQFHRKSFGDLCLLRNSRVFK
jgi:hypothetical protein